MNQIIEGQITNLAEKLLAKSLDAFHILRNLVIFLTKTAPGSGDK